MNWMLEEFGNLECYIKCVYFVGINGKGLMLIYMCYMLEGVKYKVGMFIFFYIELFNECISVNGILIVDEEIIEFVKLVKLVVEKLDEMDLGEVIEFEIIIVMVICYFGKFNFCDVVLFEIGFGGCFDFINVIYFVFMIIMNIGYDYMYILGNILGEIVYEKVGIIKFGVLVIIGV